MTTTDPLKSFGTNIPTPQNQRAPGRTDQVVNNAGGYVFEMTPVAWLRRFLTMGTTGGTFYVGQNELTMEAGNKLLEFTKTDFLHKQMVDEIVEISLEGRAPKQNPTLFALAIACQIGSTEAKQYARQQITKVVRTGTHLFIFVGYLKQFGGWSRGLRKAVANWYVEKDADQLAYQLVKYRQREGYTHRDVLRLTHPKIEEPAKRTVIDFAVKGNDLDGSGERIYLPKVIDGYMQVQSGADVPTVLETHNLPWEALPDSAMNDTKVWDKMLDNGVPMTALLRQLPRLTNLGIVSQMGGRTEDVIGQLLNADQIHKARIHPIQVLIALDTYRKGQGMRSTWTPVAKIVDALDEMFYKAFDNVEPTNLRRLDCLDVSGSMATHKAGNTNLTAREVSAAMAMVSVKSEVSQMTVAFRGDLGGSRGWGYGMNDDARLEILPISGRQRLDDVVRTVSGLTFGRTDCALPMIHALHNSWEIDTFVIYTDNETWCGNIQPFQALEQYRKSSGIDARLVVVALTPTHFTIADPRDPGMLDISGFDSAVPNMINDFAVGRI